MASSAAGIRHGGEEIDGALSSLVLLPFVHSLHVVEWVGNRVSID